MGNMLYVNDSVLIEESKRSIKTCQTLIFSRKGTFGETTVKVRGQETEEVVKYKYFGAILRVSEREGEVKQNGERNRGRGIWKAKRKLWEEKVRHEEPNTEVHVGLLTQILMNASEKIVV